MKAFRKVSDEVWVGSGSLNGFFRHDTQGNYLGHINFAPLGASRTVSAIAFIPEPICYIRSVVVRTLLTGGAENAA
ncbi:MAG TPA: hypothetical protein EYG46_15170 [Myxococcales bacterium]|nr:hypothetical protein [Myxococcales bacterium]